MLSPQISSVKWILPDGQIVTTENVLKNAAMQSPGRLVLTEVRPSDQGETEMM